MSFVDAYGNWKLITETQLTEDSTFIAVPSSPKKIIRYSYLVDWSKWDENVSVRTRCLYRWHYGLNKELVGFYSNLIPKRESNLLEYNLISPNQNIFPKELEMKLIPLNYKYRYYNIDLLLWTIRIEELLND